MDQAQKPDCDADRKDCDDINPWDCYDESTHYDCCHTCTDYTVYPVVQGCEFGDRDSPCDVDNGIRCYDNNVRQRCCATCQTYHTDKPECRYGDRVPRCESSDCHTYTTKHLDDCCSTCDEFDVTSSTTPSGTTTEWLTSTDYKSQSTNYTTMNPSVSSNTGLPTWVIPAAVSVGGLIVMLLIIIIIIMVRRNRRKSDRLSPIDEKMYNEYKLSKRAPVAPPRPLSTHKDWVVERKDSAEYAYINPDDVGGPENNARRSGTDPLPLPPATAPEYLELNDEAKYSYVKAEATSDIDRRHDNDQGVKRFNSYQLFPTSPTGTAKSENEYLQPQSHQSSIASKPYLKTYENSKM